MNGPGIYFKKIHHQMDACITRTLRKHELTSAQFDILDYLAEHTESQNTLTDLAAHFGVRHTSVIHVLKLLEKKGFIERHEIPGRRSKTITLTEQGKQLIKEISEKGPLVNQIVFAGLSGSEIQLLENMLQRISKNIESDAFRNL